MREQKKLGDKEISMPTVGGKKYSYTKKGKKAAAAAKARKRMKKRGQKRK